jgi:hypothetical protein
MEEEEITVIRNSALHSWGDRKEIRAFCVYLKEGRPEVVLHVTHANIDIPNLLRVEELDIAVPVQLQLVGVITPFMF